MREIILVFEGHTDSERKAADIIQGAIFKTLEQERMNILQFQNQPKDEKQKVAIGSPEELKETLEIPDFMKKQST